jgi:hypothetical protein
MGILPERRKNPMRITKTSIMNWGKTLLGDNVDSKNMFFKWVAIDRLSGRILWVICLTMTKERRLARHESKSQ